MDLVFFKDLVEVAALFKGKDCAAFENHPVFGDVLFPYVHSFRAKFERLIKTDSTLDIKETMVKAGFPEDHRIIVRVLNYPFV